MDNYSHVENLLSDILVSDDEVEELAADGGADGGEEDVGAAEVVGDEAVDARQDRLLVATLPQVSDDLRRDAWRANR